MSPSRSAMSKNMPTRRRSRRSSSIPCASNATCSGPSSTPSILPMSSPVSSHPAPSSRDDGSMTTGVPKIEGGAVLSFGPHVRFRLDQVRKAWIVLAPERLLLPDEQAVEILRLIDGKRDADAIIDELAGLYDAPRYVIAGDVLPMLQDLVDKKVLRQ